MHNNRIGKVIESRFHNARVEGKRTLLKGYDSALSYDNRNETESMVRPNPLGVAFGYVAVVSQIGRFD
jgi:hypothetical protein